MLISEHDDELQKNLDPGVFNDDDFITRNDSVIESSAFGERNIGSSPGRRDIPRREQPPFCPEPIHMISSKHSTDNQRPQVNYLPTEIPSTPVT